MSSPPAALVEQMIAMGFDHAQGTMALRKHANNVPAAVEWLFSKAGRDEADVKPQIAYASPPVPAQPPVASSPLAAARVRPQRGAQPVAPPNGNAPRVIQRAPAAHASLSAIAAPQSRDALQSSLPAGYSLGQVKKFFDQSDRLYGFIEVLDGGFLPDAHFKWAAVWSFGQPHLHASQAPHEPFVTAGDIVSFRLVQLPNFRNASGELCKEPKYMAMDIRVLQYTPKFPPAKRRSQEQVAAGAIAPHAPHAHVHGAGAAAVRPMRAGCAAGAGSSSLAAARPAPMVPQQPLDQLVGTRMRGVVTRTSNPSDASAGGGGGGAGGRAVGPHGFLALHHCSNATVLFFATELREVKQLAVSNPSAPVAAVAGQRMRSLHVGDVLEFTLRRDAVAMWAAEDLHVVPTRTYGQVSEQRRRELEQLEAEESVLPQIRALARKLPPLYVCGASIGEDESRQLEFKSLTRSSSSAGMGSNLVKTADKYINSFLNSGGGVILFGVEDDGTVAGLPVNKKERDQLRTTIDGLMKAATPFVDPELYSIRFVPVYRLYKSAWADVVDVGDGLQSLGALQAQSNTPADMSALMLLGERDDRVEECNPQLFIVAILVAAGHAHVPFYQTSGRGWEGRDCFVRSEGSSIKMTPMMIAERTRAKHAQSQAHSAAAANHAQAQAAAGQHNDDQGAKIAELMAMLHKMEARLSQSEAEKAATHASAAGAGANVGVSSSASVASSPSSSAASAAAEPAETSGSSSGSGGGSGSGVARGQLEIPAQLLKALIAMDFSTSDVLAAIESLHERDALDFKAAFQVGASERAQESAVNAVLEQLLSQAPSSSSGPSEAAVAASSPSSHSRNHSGSAEERRSPSALSASGGPVGLNGAQLAELQRIERDSEALELQQARAAGHDAEGSIDAEGLGPDSARSADAGAASAAGWDGAEGDLSLPCEVCGDLVEWKELEVHQRACLEREAERNDQLAAAADRQINQRAEAQEQMEEGEGDEEEQ